jgi:hypothetical protein
MTNGASQTETVFRSRLATATGIVGLAIANGIMTGAVIKSPGSGAVAGSAVAVVFTAVLWQLTWRCNVVVTQDTLRVHYLSCHRELPLTHVKGVGIEGGDLVITTRGGQRIKPWPYLASVAGVLTGYRQKKAVRDAVAARVEHAGSGECAEQHGLKWDFDVRAVVIIMAYYAVVGLIAAFR